MRVTRQQIINGIVSYIENEVLPQVDEKDKPMKVIASTAARFLQSNVKLQDEFFMNSFIKAILVEDESGTYEIDELFKAISESVSQYGSFPVTIPPIPFISPSVKTFSFDEKDIAEIKRHIERSN